MMLKFSLPLWLSPLPAQIVKAAAVVAVVVVVVIVAVVTVVVAFSLPPRRWVFFLVPGVF